MTANEAWSEEIWSPYYNPSTALVPMIDYPATGTFDYQEPVTELIAVPRPAWVADAVQFFAVLALLVAVTVLGLVWVA